MRYAPFYILSIGNGRDEFMKLFLDFLDKYEFGGIQLVIIDGIADLVHSANDEGESLRVVDELYRLAGIHQTCIAYMERMIEV